MAHRLVSDEDFLAAAIELFRTYGFEGVSLKQLADATGLEKASLYYRFPGGKEAIVMAIADALGAWLKSNVFEVLAGVGAPRKRVSTVTEKLREFYAGGTKPCLMEVLSIRGGSEELQLALKSAMLEMLNAFAQIGKECGVASAVAKSRAEEAILRLQGSLILARVVDDPAYFERTLKLLPDFLTSGQS